MKEEKAVERTMLAISAALVRFFASGVCAPVLSKQIKKNG